MTSGSEYFWGMVMKTIQTLYSHSLALLTDLYQLTMAQGYWKVGSHDREAVFHLFFRRAPFRGSYALACGIAPACEILERFHYDEDDLSYLATLSGNDGNPLFEPGFLDYLRDFELKCNVHAVAEGTVVFPHEPLLRVQGPLLQCQLVETPLLNVVNFQTLIATKASRICSAARGEPVLEFGLRRAHGIDGGLSASRAACIGGCAATSNVLAGKLFDVPVKGTHAHSWVMSFASELDSFRAYARAMPNNCVFLVDTYDTLMGVQKAVEVGTWLRQNGHEMVGIRLDSGDLTQLSIEARKILDKAGFGNAVIVASNDLDEHSIQELKRKGATIAVWGVGTKLVTAYDEPALGGVYKLSAIRDSAEADWQDTIKRSEQPIKTSNPGILQVRRFVDRERKTFVRDVIFDEKRGIGHPAEVVDLLDTHRTTTVSTELESIDLLTPVLRRGSLVSSLTTVSEAQTRAGNQLRALPRESREFVEATRYPVGLERRLHEAKVELLERVSLDEV